MSLAASSAAERSSGHAGALHIGHEAQSDGLVAYRREQRRIVQRKGSIVFDERHIVATQRGSMCTHGQPKKVVGCLALLCLHADSNSKKKEYGEQTLFHFHVQRYTFYFINANVRHLLLRRRQHLTTKLFLAFDNESLPYQLPCYYLCFDDKNTLLGEPNTECFCA